MKGVFMPTPSPYDLSPSARSQTSALVGDGGEQTEIHSLIGGSMDTVNDKQVATDLFICVLISCNLMDDILYCS